MFFFIFQTLCTVEEDPDGERIEDQLFVLRDQLLQLSPAEQQLNGAPADQAPVSVDSRPAIPPATSAAIQTTLQVNHLLHPSLFSCFLIMCVTVA